LGVFHGVRFYSDDGDLCRSVAAFFSEGFLLGHPALAIASAAHCAGIEACLSARGFHVPTLVRTGQLCLLDAESRLAEILVNGTIDEQRFRRLLAPMLDRAGEAGSQLRAYGEIVDILWKRTQPALALRLEALWNGVLRGHEDVLLLCGYDRHNTYIDTDVEDICGQHSHVLSETDTALLAL